MKDLAQPIGPPDFLDDLYRELTSQPNTFLARLRALTWDKDAFQRLLKLMRRAGAFYAHRELLDRWLVEGADFLAEFVPEWTSHPNFPRPDQPDYYESAYKELRLLKQWLFTGIKPPELQE